VRHGLRSFLVSAITAILFYRNRIPKAFAMSKNSAPRFTVSERQKKKPPGTVYAAGLARSDEQRKGVAAVDSAVTILRILDLAAGAISLGQVARAAAFLPSKTHHYLVSLVRTGMAKQDPDTGLYSLGDFATSLGRAARHKGPLAPRISEAMAVLSRSTRQATMFTQWSQRGPLVTHWADGRRSVGVSSRVGAVVPLWNSPTGDIFLSWLPDRVLATAVRDGLLLGVSERQLHSVRTRVRRDGASYAQGRRDASIAAVAVPVFDPAGGLAGALTLVGRQEELEDQKGSADDLAVRDAAMRVSNAMQGSDMKSANEPARKARRPAR